MLKYTDTQVVFREFPDEVSLCINISNCPFNCPGCHSPELQQDIGTELTFKELHKLIYSNEGVTLIGFMGGNPEEVNELAEYVKNVDPPLKVGWYWGGNLIPSEINIENFDYIKLGPYIAEKGPLNNPNTNQKMYKIGECTLPDGTTGMTIINITNKFWNKES